MVISTVLILPIHEHSISFCWLVLFSVSFINILWFSEYKSYSSLVRFGLRYYFWCESGLRFISFVYLLKNQLWAVFCFYFPFPWFLLLSSLLPSFYLLGVSVGAQAGSRNHTSNLNSKVKSKELLTGKKWLTIARLKENSEDCRNSKDKK